MEETNEEKEEERLEEGWDKYIKIQDEIFELRRQIYKPHDFVSALDKMIKQTEDEAVEAHCMLKDKQSKLEWLKLVREIFGQEAELKWLDDERCEVIPVGKIVFGIKEETEDNLGV